MKKSNKKITYQVGKIISAIIVGILIYRAISIPSMTVPYTYFITPYALDNDAIKNSDLLIIGDRMGVRFNSYLKLLNEKSSINLKKPLSIYNLSAEHEGLHRTLAKIKSLDRLPPLTIYMGASEEFYERKFYIDEYNSISWNLRLYKNDYLSTLLLLYPVLAKLFYFQTSYISLSSQEIVQNQTPYPAALQQKIFEVGHLFFEHELEELAELVKQKKSKLVIVTPPINLEMAPKKNCSNSTNSYIAKQHNDASLAIEENRIKDALAILSQTSKLCFANATQFYLDGLAKLKMGEKATARPLLARASAFDCDSSRSSYVFNLIEKKVAQRRGLLMADFHEIVQKQLGFNTLFSDEIYPQTVFYYELAESLSKLIRYELNL